MTNIAKVYIGVDISKDTLDVYTHPTGSYSRIANSEKAIKKFIKGLNRNQIKYIACEATGGYEKLLAKLLKKYDFNLWIVDPRRIRGFIIATGCKSKTDKIDAKKIAEFASKNTQKYVTFEKSKNHDQLQALVNRKDDLTKFLVAEKTRLKHPSHALSKGNITKIIKILKKEIKVIDSKIADLIEQDNVLSKQSKLLESIPGIGKASAATLLSSVPELGKLSNKKISALVGVCPFDNQSGKFRGKKFIRGGRASPRKMLYMCALTTIKYNLCLKAFYDRLIEKKPFKVAIVAVMHKLIILANTILKKGELCKV